MIEYFTLRNLDDDMAELAIVDGFEWLQGMFLYYNGDDIIYTFCASPIESDEDDEIAELLSLRVDDEEEKHLEIIAKKEFNPPGDFTPEELIRDLNDVLVAMTYLSFSPDGNTLNISLELLDNDDDAKNFIKKYFTKPDKDYSFKVK